MMFIHLLWSSAAYSQRAFSSFGPTIDLPLNYTPIGLSRIPTGIAVLAQETPAVYSYTLTPSGVFNETEVLSLGVPAKELAVSIEGTGVAFEVATLSAGGELLEVHRSREGRSEASQWTLQLPSQSMTYADVNNDRRMDILLFGKKRTGIDVMLKAADGRYVKGPQLFPDISISAVRSADLNKDGITDLFTLNWLDNKLALYYGIGLGVFSEQVEVTLPGEPTAFDISPVTNARTLRIAVCIPDEKLVALFRCNATGEIEPDGELHLPVAPRQVQFGDINNDGVLDLIATTPQAVYVFPGISEDRLGPGTPFSAGSATGAAILLDLDGDGRVDMAAIDKMGKRLIGFANAEWTSKVAWPSVFSVGSSPKSIVSVDLNRDGLPDVVVSNSGSSTLSVLLNRGSSRLAGQRALPVAENPFTLKYVHQSTAEEPTIVVSHASGERISIVRLADEPGSSTVVTLPSGPNPYVVFARRDSSSDRLELLARYLDAKDGSISLSLFSQIGGGNFLERSIRPKFQGRVSALTVDDFSQAGMYELAFVTHDKSTKQSTLSIAVPVHEFDFKAIKQVLTFADSSSSVRSIVSGFVDDDVNKDLVLILSSPRNSLGIVYGKGGGAFEDSIEFIRNVQPMNEDALILADVDLDGHSDITWLDTGRNAVVTMYGRGNRRFETPVVISAANRVSAIHVARISSIHSLDLIMANSSKGTLSVIQSPFRR